MKSHHESNSHDTKQSKQEEEEEEKEEEKVCNNNNTVTVGKNLSPLVHWPDGSLFSIQIRKIIHHCSGKKKKRDILKWSRKKKTSLQSFDRP
jgi:hypothetical protein